MSKMQGELWGMEPDTEYDSDGPYEVTALYRQRQIIHAIGKPWEHERIAILEGSDALNQWIVDTLNKAEKETK